MNDLYLKFPDPAAMLDALRPLGMTYFAPIEPTPYPEPQIDHEIDPETDHPEGEERASQGSHQFALWEVGEIPGIEGWHVNLRVIDPEFDVSSLEPFAAHPTSPRCIWA